ncbi:Pentatricopeptide repeat [Quillaja saponaria]|uniref:Pentatricopeptide repeat n=1 Tax=Quillaja saponaria TaxID=32244 RepID=A0AAD7P9Q4_QUISA|nr:Pentatricopeptide repeat [Quillaja saponaria]
MFENAQKVFDEMPERECTRTVLSMNALLAASVHSKKFDMVGALFKELPMKLSVEPDSVSYNTVIKAFCEMGSFDSAVSMLDEMESKGLEPDLITFNTLLNGLYGKGRFSDGEKIWNRMNEKNVVANIRSYNSKLQGLAAEKKTKEAVDLLEEMRNKGLKPDVFSFNSIIKGFVNEGNLEDATRWYSEIGNSGYDPDKRTFASLVPFLCGKGDLKTAFEVCNEIFICHCLVDTALMQLVVNSLVKQSKIEEAKKIVHLGKTNRYCRYKLTLPSDE